MAKKAKKGASSSGDGFTQRSSEEKIARLLAMLVVKEFGSDAAKVPVLHSAGFTTAEIAEILGTTEGTVRVAASRARKK